MCNKTHETHSRCCFPRGLYIYEGLLGDAERHLVCGKQFREIFKSITCDNGSDNMECSCLARGKKTTLYYAHPCTLCLRVKLFTHPIPFSDLTEFIKDTERGADKSLKKPLCPLCLRAKLYPIPFWISRRSQRTRRGAEKALKNLCSKLCLSRSPQRTRREKQTNR